jgi:hypothetical protein
MSRASGPSGRHGSASRGQGLGVTSREGARVARGGSAARSAAHKNTINPTTRIKRPSFRFLLICVSSIEPQARTNPAVVVTQSGRYPNGGGLPDVFRSVVVLPTDPFCGASCLGPLAGLQAQVAGPPLLHNGDVLYPSQPKSQEAGRRTLGWTRKATSVAAKAAALSPSF